MLIIFLKTIKTEIVHGFGTSKQRGLGRTRIRDRSLFAAEIYFLEPNTRVHAQRVSTAEPTATAIGS